MASHTPARDLDGHFRAAVAAHHDHHRAIEHETQTYYDQTKSEPAPAPTKGTP